MGIFFIYGMLAASFSYGCSPSGGGSGLWAVCSTPCALGLSTSRSCSLHGLTTSWLPPEDVTVVPLRGGRCHLNPGLGLILCIRRSFFLGVNATNLGHSIFTMDIDPLSETCNSGFVMIWPPYSPLLEQHSSGRRFLKLATPDS